MRFRKSIKLFPGVKINLSKTGISTTLGPRGASLNLKPGRPPRVTGSIPGTGLSHTETLDNTESKSVQRATEYATPIPEAPRSGWAIAWSATRAAINVVGMIALGILAGIAAVFLLGSKKRK